MTSMQCVLFKMHLQITYCDTEMKSETVPPAHVMSLRNRPLNTLNVSLVARLLSSMVFHVSMIFLSCHRWFVLCLVCIPCLGLVKGSRDGD